jgi:carbon monoxide dehydrogenase subunit G
MKTLKSFLVVIAIIFIALWLGSFGLNEKWHYEKSISINSTPDKIYQLTTDLKNWEKWSPWYGIDTNAKWTFSDTTFGVGAWYTWSSEVKKVGKGKITIIEVIENQSNKYKLEFDGMNASIAGFILEPEGDFSTKVTWTLDGENKGLSKWFGVLIGVFMSEDYENGLANIKRICETK